MSEYTVKNKYYPIITIGIMFFIFGFVTWASSVLIPYLQIACELNEIQSFFVTLAFYFSYFFMAIPSGFLLKWIGYKRSMSVGLLMMAVGSLLFIPAAMQRTYWIFLLGLFVQGLGLAILQTAANPYVTILGPRESGARRMSIMGICNGIAGILAPIILGTIVLDNADNISVQLLNLNPDEKNIILNELAHKVIMPYIIIAVILAILSLLIYLSKLSEIEDEPEENQDTSDATKKKSIFQFPHLLLGVFTLFIYVGVEVIAGNTIIGYGSYLGIEMSISKFFTSLTLAFMFIGYVIGIICIPKYFSQQQSLKVSAVLGILFVIGSQLTSGYVSILFIALLGLSNSLMWPSIWPLAIADLGKFTKLGSSLLVMAICGGGVFPLLYGLLGEVTNLKRAYLMIIPCYLIIELYALWGHKIRINKTEK